MASYVDRAKAIVGNIKSKDQVVPPNAYLTQLCDAYVRAFLPQWRANLLKLAVPLVINPSNLADPFDIGTLSGETFTPASAGDKTKACAFHFLDTQRQNAKQIIVADQKNDVLLVGEAGQTPAAAGQARKDAAASEADTELGDPDNDPET